MQNNIFLFLAVLSVCVASFSQVLLKMGANRTYENKLREYLNVYVVTGYGMLFASMVLTIVAYSRLNFLSVPVVEALGYVLVPVLSYFFFRERMSLRKVLGILLILVGIGIYYL